MLGSLHPKLDQPLPTPSSTWEATIICICRNVDLICIYSLESKIVKELDSHCVRGFRKGSRHLLNALNLFDDCAHVSLKVRRRLARGLASIGSGYEELCGKLNGHKGNQRSLGWCQLIIYWNQRLTTGPCPPQLLREVQDRGVEDPWHPVPSERLWMP